MFVGAGGFVVDEKLFSFDLEATARLTERWGLGAWSSFPSVVGREGTSGVQPGDSVSAPDCGAAALSTSPRAGDRSTATPAPSQRRSGCSSRTPTSCTASRRRRIGKFGLRSWGAVHRLRTASRGRVRLHVRLRVPRDVAPRRRRVPSEEAAVRLIVIAAVIAASGCVTLHSGTTQRIRVASTPPDAQVFLDGQLVGPPRWMSP